MHLLPLYDWAAFTLSSGWRRVFTLLLLSPVAGHHARGETELLRSAGWPDQGLLPSCQALHRYLSGNTRLFHAHLLRVCTSVRVWLLISLLKLSSCPSWAPTSTQSSSPCATTPPGPSGRSACKWVSRISSSRCWCLQVPGYGTWHLNFNSSGFVRRGDAALHRYGAESAGGDHQSAKHSQDPAGEHRYCTNAPLSQVTWYDFFFFCLHRCPFSNLWELRKNIIFDFNVGSTWALRDVTKDLIVICSTSFQTE